ncbi:MAG: ATP-binding protein [Bacteroidales bacterium]|nr:ATP-binding protein [Bacteroidales bacterium]MBQ9711132.1 ATP-binding protein [Bacteroidales bacterium]
MELLKRKIDAFLASWKQNPQRKPLIVKGARQIGKTRSIQAFGEANYESVIEINFVLQKKFRSIFDNGYEVDTIIKNISLLEPSWKFIPYKTLIFFDELQKCPDCATSLKSFNADPRYDVICSCSLMGIYYEEIESNAVGNKEDYEMHSMDFEEFLWAKGYSEAQVEDLYTHMASLTPFSELELSTYMDIFRDYMTIGGMPEVVKMYIDNGHFGGTLELLRQLLLDYEEDITKYAKESDKAKILAVYRHISTFLAKTSKKFQITKVAHGARNREYIGAVEWLEKAGVVNVCYCLSNPELPLKGNYDADTYKVYYHDTGLLIASLDEEAQEDLRANKNFGTYKGAIYENIVGEMLRKSGYEQLYYYKNDSPALEMDFFVRDSDSLVPVEVKAKDGATASLNHLIDWPSYPDVSYGIKFGYKNIGWGGKFYTFPYFLAFLLKRFLKEAGHPVQ